MIFERGRYPAIARESVFLMAYSVTGLPQQIARADAAFVIFGGLMLGRRRDKLAFCLQPSRETKLRDMLE